jgi:hypothetical protein
MGTPDDFYDIRSDRFRQLFRYLLDEGCEIGLHASWNAWRTVDILAAERRRVEETCGVTVEGNRHHYWHLNPDAPDETLALHEAAGLAYDSSLGLEFYPGFRRGICHPFRPYHIKARREITTLQLPPCWMDDHFDRRLVVNRISDPVDCARSLIRTVASLGGVIVVDYHSRGMNSDFYPRYGKWLRTLMERDVDSSIRYRTAAQVVHDYARYERQLISLSRDVMDTVRAGAAVC